MMMTSLEPDAERLKAPSLKERLATWISWKVVLVDEFSLISRNPDCWVAPASDPQEKTPLVASHRSLLVVEVSQSTKPEP